MGLPDWAVNKLIVGAERRAIDKGWEPALVTGDEPF
jgi:hypothetical protein